VHKNADYLPCAVADDIFFQILSVFCVHVWLFLFVCLFVCSDPLHTYLGICGLALIGEPGLATVHPALNISQRAADHLYDLQKQWES
jgi:hypothetical protein